MSSGGNIRASSKQPKVSQDHEIRSKLLNKLGIYGSSLQGPAQPMTAAQHRRLRILRGMGVGYALPQSPPDGSATRKPLGGVVTFQEPLKCDSNPPRKTSVAFQEAVEVLPVSSL